MAVRYFEDLEQGSDEWLAQRCGLLTASEMKLIITPSTLKPADNDKTRVHLYELLAQRITGYVDPHYVNDDMLRGHQEEIDAKAAYAKHIAPIRDVGFITNDKWGFTLGYSPDGLVGEDGGIEVKSRLQKYQVSTIVAERMPDDFLMQVQAGMLVAERSWIDFISYSGGLPMIPIRIEADPKIQDAILAAATKFEAALQEKLDRYREVLRTNRRLIPTTRRVEMEIYA